MEQMLSEIKGQKKREEYIILNKIRRNLRLILPLIKRKLISTFLGFGDKEEKAMYYNE